MTTSVDQALYKFIDQLVNSADGIRRAVRATNEGQPAVAGVDELLRQELGSEYHRANNGAWWAGFAVARLMRELGYVEAGTAKCPPACVAEQGIVWKPKSASKMMSAADWLTAAPGVCPE